jgi:hypothetical protein
LDGDLGNKTFDDKRESFYIITKSLEGKIIPKPMDRGMKKLFKLPMADHGAFN